MIQVHCRTNLDDVMRIERWPEELPERPMLGDNIRSEIIHSGRFQLELEVVGVTWKGPRCQGYSSTDLQSWHLEVELHIPSWQKSMSIGEWQQWYKKARGVHE